MLCKQIGVSGCVRYLLFCNFISWGLAEPGFVHGGSAADPVFSPNTAEQVGMRVGVPVQLSSSLLLLCVFWVCKLSA